MQSVDQGAGVMGAMKFAARLQVIEQSTEEHKQTPRKGYYAVCAIQLM